jgi:hypothetical protein
MNNAADSRTLRISYHLDSQLKTVTVIIKFIFMFKHHALRPLLHAVKITRSILSLCLLNGNKKDTKYGDKQQTNSVALARKRTIPTKRPPLVGEVSANFCGEGVAWSAQRIPMAVFSVF